MKYRIEYLGAKKLVGMRLQMSLSNNKTVELWRSFMMRRKTITNQIGNDLYSVQVYDSLYFCEFNINHNFEKWATVEVTDFDSIPEKMESLLLPEGFYVVFLYKGAASAGAKVFQYIYNTWLPSTIFALDNRPHFEILGEKYKNEHPDSEEEIWIPVKKRD